MTVAIEIGRTATGEPASLDLEELLTTRLLVQGNSGSGKLCRAGCLNKAYRGYSKRSLIPKANFATLAEQYGHLVIDAEEHTERGLQVAAERARAHRVSTILNLEGLDAEKTRCGAPLLFLAACSMLCGITGIRC